MAAASVIAFFSTAVFLGNVAFSATGFAMAIVFLFLYQLGSLAWLDCCNIRYAVFIQTIGFVVILPITLWRSNLRDNLKPSWMCLQSVTSVTHGCATTPLSAGGVGMFISSQLQYNVLERTSSSSYQAFWIEIVDANKKENICGVVYRQHDKADDFLNYLSSSIELYSSRNRNIYLMGDFNIDLLKFESCSYSKELLELTQSFSLLPAVDKPTRVYGNSATLIDNIFSNNLENSLICGNIVTDTTDHFTQVCIVATHPNPLNYSKQRKKIRDYSSFNANRFLSELQEIEWSNSSDNDANKSFTTFYKKINCLVNKHAPMKTLSKRRGKILSKPWITKGIRTSIRIKNNLFFNADWEHYKLYRNKITSLTRQSKKNYYERYFEENINNSKETWRGINDIISRKAKSDKKPIHRLVNSNSETICNPKEISNSLNTFFATVGHKLASCIPSSSPDHDFSTFLDPPIQSSFYFDPFVPAEVEDEIKVLPNNKAYGLYSCPVSILKLSSHIISQPLAQIFNVSVSSGSFPAKLKTAKVVPVFKSKPGNYRPISLL